MSGYGGDPRYAGYQRQPQPWGMYAGAVASPVRGLLETFAPGASDFAAARDSVAYGGQMSSALRRGDWGDAVGPGLLSLAAGLGALPMVPSVVSMMRAAPREEALRVAQKNAETMLGLPPDNTPMQRAAAMGFEPTDYYHGTSADFGEFDLSRAGQSTTVGKGEKAAFLTDSPKQADSFLGKLYWNDAGTVAEHYPTGANVMPLMARNRDAWDEWDWGGNPYNDAQMRDILKQARKDKVPAVLFEKMRDGGFTHVGRLPVGNVLAVRDPAIVRSRFAAFDPARRNSRDLLASVGGAGLLGAIAYGDDE